MSKKILIADDEKVIRLVLRRLLEKSGEDWDIMEAADGGTIMDAYFESEPDYILLDVQLPEIDGWEILQCIRENDTHTKIIMVTGSATPEDVSRAVELGASGFVGKPFDSEELADALGLGQRNFDLVKSA